MDKTNFKSVLFEQMYNYSKSKMNNELKLEIIEKENLILINMISELFDKISRYEEEQSNSRYLLSACINSFKTFFSIGTTMESEIMVELENAIKKADPSFSFKH